MNMSGFKMQRLVGVEGFAASMDQSLVNRYQPGGDIYANLASTRGAGAADQVAAAARSGSRENVVSTMALVNNGPATGSTSVFQNFMQQITTDPLKAPIAAAMGQGSSGPGLGDGSTTGKVIKGIATLGVIGLVLYGLNTYARVKGK